MHEAAFLQLKRPVSGSRGFGVVRYHDNGFPVISSEGIEQFQDGVCGFSIQIAGWFICD